MLDNWFLFVSMLISRIYIYINIFLYRFELLINADTSSRLNIFYMVRGWCVIAVGNMGSWACWNGLTSMAKALLIYLILDLLDLSDNYCRLTGVKTR